MRWNASLLNLIPRDRKSSPEVLEWFDAMFHQEQASVISECNTSVAPHAPVVDDPAAAYLADESENLRPLDLLAQMAAELRQITVGQLLELGKNLIVYLTTCTRGDKTVFILNRADGTCLVEADTAEEAVEMADSNNLCFANVH